MGAAVAFARPVRWASRSKSRRGWCAWAFLGAILLSLGAMPRSVNAETFPSRSIRLVVPFAAGGINDVIARAWAEGVRADLGSLVIENKGGGGGVIAATEVSRAAPDGYTLLLGSTTTQVVLPLLGKPAPYDASNFEAIDILTVVPNAFAVNPKLGPKTLPELIDYASRNPGKVSFGSAGRGSLTHIAAEMLKKAAGVDLVHVPYRGVAPGLTDLVAGHIPMFSASMAAQLLELHKTGKIRILAVNSVERLEIAPDIPTTIEAGYPSLVATNFNGVFAPAGTPRDVLEKVAAASRKALSNPSVRSTLLGTGGQVLSMPSVAAAADMVRAEQKRWAPVIEDLRGLID